MPIVNSIHRVFGQDPNFETILDLVPFDHEAASRTSRLLLRMKEVADAAHMAAARSDRNSFLFLSNCRKTEQRPPGGIGLC
jgi:hypothetical protein